MLASAAVFLDTALYAALTPLLPEFAEEYGLSKGASGLLVAAYPAGVLLGAVPAGIAAARLGPKSATVVGSLLLAAASVGFALAPSAPVLAAARVGQGLGSALTWAGALAWLVAVTSAERRGQVLGTALGGAIFGAVFGPVLGALASGLGTAPTFTGVAVLAFSLAGWALASPGAGREQVDFRAVRVASRERLFLAGLALMVLPALLFGVLNVLPPLRLDAAGWGAAAIGAVFLIGASLEAVLSPLIGRLADRRGRLLPVRVGLIASLLVSLALATAGRPIVIGVLVVAAALAYGALLPPGLALVSDGAARSGLAQGLAFGLMNAAWATGAAVGPALAGALSDRTGDAIPFLLCAVLSLAAFAAAAPRTLAPRVKA